MRQIQDFFHSLAFFYQSARAMIASSASHLRRLFDTAQLRRRFSSRRHSKFFNFSTSVFSSIPRISARLSVWSAAVMGLPKQTRVDEFETAIAVADSLRAAQRAIFRPAGHGNTVFAGTARARERVAGAGISRPSAMRAASASSIAFLSWRKASCRLA